MANTVSTHANPWSCVMTRPHACSDKSRSCEIGVLSTPRQERSKYVTIPIRMAIVTTATRTRVGRVELVCAEEVGVREITPSPSCGLYRSKLASVDSARPPK